MAQEGDEVTLAQVPTSAATGLYGDPYFASGSLFSGCYPAASVERGASGVTTSLVDASVGFAEALRRAGLSVGVADTLDFVRALELLDMGRRADVRAASRAIFVRRHEDAARHDAVFDAYWRERRDPGRNDAEWAGAHGQNVVAR